MIYLSYNCRAMCPYVHITGPPDKPVLVVDESERDVLTTATMTCDGGDANPAVSMVTWYQDVTLVTSSTNQTLSIYLNNILHEGNYTCVKSNQPPGYQTQTSGPSAPQQLIVNGELHSVIERDGCGHL